MNQYDSRLETEEHIDLVRTLTGVVAGDLIRRGDVHDESKLEEPEKAVFDEYTPKLRDTEYGSPEYKEHLIGMGIGLAHHYGVNDHHPEHFPAGPIHETEAEDFTNYLPGGEQTLCRAWCQACEWTKRGDPVDVRNAAWMHELEETVLGGIEAMNLMQIAEMLCDWIAATRRHIDGDIHDSIRKNADRFGYDAELEGILHRTADAILALEP